MIRDNARQMAHCCKHELSHSILVRRCYFQVDFFLVGGIMTLLKSIKIGVLRPNIMT